LSQEGSPPEKGLLPPELEMVQTQDCQKNRDVQPARNLENDIPKKGVHERHVPQDDKNNHHDDITVLVNIEA
jgi:hypothetical protein